MDVFRVEEELFGGGDGDLALPPFGKVTIVPISKEAAIGEQAVAGAVSAAGDHRANGVRPL